MSAKPFIPNTQWVVKSDNRQIVLGVVYAPNVVDTDGEAMTSEEVEKTAHSFLASGKVNRIDLLHNRVPTSSRVIESFIARPGDPDFPVGAWVIAVKIEDADIWRRVKKGEINGFSMQGKANIERRLALVSFPVLAVGRVEKSTDDGLLPSHDHEVKIEFDAAQRMVSTRTGEALHHFHVVKSSSSTEMAVEHAHRIVFEGEAPGAVSVEREA